MTHRFLTVVFLFLTTASHGQLSVTRGIASFYASKFEGKTTASGEKYQHDLLTAAHRTLPFGTMVKVTNLANNKSVIVRVNDRGPFVDERIIDVSRSAADSLGFLTEGLTEVAIEVVTEQSNPSTATSSEQEKRAIQTTSPSGSQTATPTASSTPVANVPQVSTAFYRLSTQRFSPTGFGVQVASYQEPSNLLERAAAIEQQLQQPIAIQIVNTNGNRIYRLIVGQFETRAQAEYFKDSIKESYPGFVVSF